MADDLDGQLILETLNSLEQPATLKLIISTVAEVCGTQPNQVQNTVKKILKGGVEHGYVQYTRGKYSAGNYDAEEGGDAEVGNKTPIKKIDVEQPEDATRRRRRSSSRRRPQSRARRSRSRRRRRSSTRS